jgi:uncharacterized membrane protein YjgN (DUF898 family)
MSAAVYPPRTSTTASASTSGELPLKFAGSTTEYFRIWIVNMCLTLFTLGIFSAWAKVRKKRYFYSHTMLDGTPFQYLGRPIPILKGRLIAAVLLVTWYAATNFVTQLIPVVLIIAFILAPWVVVRSAAFNARYSAFRNMTFEFDGTYKSGAKVIYGWTIPLVVVLAVGLSLVYFASSGSNPGRIGIGVIAVLVVAGVAYALWQQRVKRYMVAQTSFGGVHGEFGATAGQFFRTYAVATLAAGIGGGILVGLSMSLATTRLDKSTMAIVMTVIGYAVYVSAYAYVRTRITNLVWSNTRLGPLRFRSFLRVRELFGLYVTNAIAILASAGLLIPWATVRTLKYRIEHLAITTDGDLHEFQGTGIANAQAVGAEVSDLFDFDMSI